MECQQYTAYTTSKGVIHHRILQLKTNLVTSRWPQRGPTKPFNERILPILTSRLTKVTLKLVQASDDFLQPNKPSLNLFPECQMRASTIAFGWIIYSHPNPFYYFLGKEK